MTSRIAAVLDEPFARHALRVAVFATLGCAGLSAMPATAVAATVGTQWGTVNEPVLPTSVCATVAAQLTPVGGSVDALDATASSAEHDTTRIQNAIAQCAAGSAVHLTAGANGETAFISGPLTLQSGVTLWIDKGVTLFASRNPALYDNGVGTCGTATSSSKKSCNPFISASGTANAAIVGDGVIDGRGGSLLTSGPNAGLRTWWDVAYQNKTQGLNQQNPRLLEVKGGSNFTLYRITLQNSPNFHVVTNGVTGVTAWGIKIVTPSAVYTKSGYACPAGTQPNETTPATCFTPDTVKNTDGFDPGQSSQVLLAFSYISTGDDHVAVKSSASPGVKQVTIAHNHFYYGHGMSIGSETNAGVSDVDVRDLTMDGFDSPNGNGLRIKSDSSRGGLVTNVRFRQVCMRNVARPLVFDPFYSSSTGTLYPDFTNITVQDFHFTGSAKFGGGKVTFSGYEANGQHFPLGIALNNVVFDGTQPTFEKDTATHYTLGPGAVSFSGSIVTSSANDVTATGTPGTSTPYDCSAAFTTLKSVAPTSPI
ncbi:glycoside hydrolase family 28 protein [Burkholderia sp. SR8]|uniref:glycoside hydrolase family 28 protein n=1 Tax=Burkholderia sp. SR8 TaxID=3062277 RepID=UPI004063C287